MRVAQEMEAKLEQEEEVCNETMKALWEECKPCLKNTCVKYYSRTCSSGSGLVGRQVRTITLKLHWVYSDMLTPDTECWPELTLSLLKYKIRSKPAGGLSVSFDSASIFKIWFALLSAAGRGAEQNVSFLHLDQWREVRCSGERRTTTEQRV